MNAKTLKALKGSIAHWERLSSGTAKSGEDVTSKSCPLCKLFLRENSCEGCPVAKATKKWYCVGSPWERVRAVELGRGLRCDEFKEAAKKELQFLKSLLPNKKTTKLLAKK